MTSQPDDSLSPVVSPDLTREQLVEEIIFWRTAALTRWAQRASEEGGRTNKDLVDEVAHLKHLLNATRATMSWKVTAPLRAVQSARLRSGRR
jgi:hypothetical protein